MSGTWRDNDGSGWAEDGESVAYIVTITNNGTVTLGTLTVTDGVEELTCDGPTAGLLGQNEQFECRSARQVCKRPQMLVGERRNDSRSKATLA